MIVTQSRRPRAETRSRLYALLFLIAFSTIVGLGTGSQPSLVMGVALASLLVVQATRLVQAGEGIAVQRNHPPRCLEGETLAATLTLSNGGRSRYELVEVEDRFAAARSQAVCGLIVAFPPHTRTVLSTSRRCDFRRGFFLLGPVTLTFSDELGLFRRRRRIGHYTELVVCPRLVAASHVSLAGQGTRPNVGMEFLWTSGRSEQFAGVRDYREGDPWRYVHWRTSARRGGLYVKEFDRNIVTHVTIVVDLFRAGQAGLGAVTSVEQRLRTAATFCASAIERHHFVRLIAAKSPVDSTPMAGGPAQLARLMQWLAVQSARGEGHIEDVVLEELPHLRRGSTLVLVLSSTSLDLGRLAATVRMLRGRNVEIVAALIEDRTYLKLHPDQVERFAQAPPLELAAGELRVAGARVYCLERGTSVLTPSAWRRA